MERLRNGLLWMKQRERGQGLVEFAITLFLLLMLTIGTIYTIQTLYKQLILAVATADGAREAAIQGGDSEIVEATIRSTLDGFFVRGEFGYTVVPPEAGWHEELTVEVTYLEPVKILFWEFQLKAQRSTRRSEVDYQWGAP